MTDLVTQIKEKELELWYLYLALQELKAKDPGLFKRQDFSKVRDTCSHIMSLVSEAEMDTL